LICTPISLTAQRNGGTRQRNAFQPLQFAPANAVPFIRGLKRSTVRTAVPIPDRHRSGRRRFSFCMCRPAISGCFLTGWDYNPSVTFGDTSLYAREALPSGLPGNPSSVSLRLTPFAQPQTADPSVCYADISPNRGVSSGKAVLPGEMRRNTSSVICFANATFPQGKAMFPFRQGRFLFSGEIIQNSP